MTSIFGEGFDNPLHLLEPIAVYPLSYTALPRTNGVYAIVNIINGNFYIGSAADDDRGFNGRFVTHRGDFRNGLENAKKGFREKRQQNKRFQNAYNKYGPDAFEVWILLECDSDDCIYWEQYFFDNYDPEYNICKIAGSTKGTTQSDESNRKRSKAGKGRKRDPESVAKGIETRRANWKGFSRGALDRMSAAKVKPFKAYHPEEGYIKGIGLNKFLESKGIGNGCWSHIMHETRWQCKGYFKNEERYLMWLETQDRWFEIYHPDEGLIRYNGIKEFCEVRNLHYSSIFKVVYGGCFTSQGYFKNEQDYLDYKEKNKNNPQSQYECVSWSKEKEKWCARVGYKDPLKNKRKTKNLGYFINDYEAYQKVLEFLPTVEKYRSNRVRRKHSF